LFIAAILIGVAAVAAWIGVRLSSARRRNAEATSIAAQLDPRLTGPRGPKFTPVKSTALRRGAQEVYESREATQDLALLARQLRDIRDQCVAEEAIFWRWLEERETLVPTAWSTEGATKP